MAGRQSSGSPFGSLLPSTFPPGTDPKVVASFEAAREDDSGFINAEGLQKALEYHDHPLSLDTVRHLMYDSTDSDAGKMGPKQYLDALDDLNSYRWIFRSLDTDRIGKIHRSKLRGALLNVGYDVYPRVLDMLESKYVKSGGSIEAINYDNFIRCCLTVKGLTEKFKEKECGSTGSATFTRETFMLTVLPFVAGAG